MKQVQIDFTKPLGRIAPQHGFCNFPTEHLTAHYRGSPDAGESERLDEMFHEIGCPLIRLKDPRSGGYGKKIEVPFVFRDFSKDPDDPASWYWYVTDPYLRQALLWQSRKGSRLMIRLGAPREQWAPIFNNKPADYDKFARVCLNYIRHVNGDFADGLNARVTDWEIWDRADDPKHWGGGTWEDYYRLYGVVAQAIRKEFPELRVGGPSAADCSGDCAFLEGFIRYVRENGLPCDFITWNYYGEDPDEAFRQAQKVRKLVRAAKLPKQPEILVSAWNCMTIGEDGFFVVPHVNDIRGAAFCASFMLAMQKAGMDASMYYECEKSLPWAGLVHPAFLRPEKPLFAFTAFARLYRTGTSVHTRVVGRHIRALAGTDGTNETAVVSVFQKGADEIEVFLGSRKARTVRVLDEGRNLARILSTSDETIRVRTEGYTVLLIETA